MITKKELLEIRKLHKKPLPGGYVGTATKPFVTVMKDQAGRPKRMMMIAKHTVKAGSEHTAYVAFDGDTWHIGCGNKFLEGETYTAADAENLATIVSRSGDEKEDILRSYACFEKNSYCHFWRNWNDKKTPCKHVNDLLNDISEFEIDQMQALYEGEEGDTSVTDKTASSDEVMVKMSRYAHRRHLLITGEKGSGKTRSVYEYLRKSKLPHVFVGGDQDIEAIDLKGMLMPAQEDGEKKFIWADGPLTEAFRRAASGEKVVLFIDEMLRISRSGLSVLIPALTLNDNNEYVLKTGRIIDVKDGVGKTETLYAPRENLWVVATTNIGAGYDVSSLDHALEDRFEYVEYNNGLEKITEVISVVVAEQELSADIAVKLVSFYKNTQKLYKAEQLTKLVNLRHLVQIVEDLETEADLYTLCCDRIPKWVERDMDGKLLEDQKKLIIKALDAAGISPAK